MIRKGRYEDIPAIFECGIKLREAYYQREVPMHRPSVVRSLSEFIRSPEKILLVVDKGYLTGFSMFSCEPYWDVDPRYGRRYVTDWAFYSELFGGAREMLRVATAWAWSMPRVIELKMACQIEASDEAMDRLFLTEGFVRCGRIYRLQKGEADVGSDKRS